MKRSTRVIRFIEAYCRVPSGAHVGKPIKLEPFQKSFIRDVYDNPHGTRRGILSIARKNGKTALIAGLVLAHLVGPEALQNTQIVSGAMSRDQAGIVFDLAVKMVNLNDDLSALVHIVPSSKRLIGKPMGVEYRALAAEGKTAHGLSPVLAILDEVGQVRGPRSDFVDAIVTSQGAHAHPMTLTISTQAPNDGDLLSVWIDDAQDETKPTPHIVCHLHSAAKDCKLSDRDEWRNANPALGVFRDLEDMKLSAQDAERMPSYESSFRNLFLNQRVEARSPFISRDVWKRNSGEPQPFGKRKVFGGLDLSQVQDLTALVLVAPGEDGTADVVPTFWLPAEGLVEKARADRVHYDVWHNQGYLQTCPGASIGYEWVAHRLREVFDEYDVQAIAFDRWGMRHLLPWLEKEGFTSEEMERFVPFGQGFKDMSPALRTTEEMVLQGKLRHGAHPVLTMCAQNAVVVSDPADNRKLDKKRASGRIDGMVALAMALGAMGDKMSDDNGLDDFLNDPIIVSY